MWCDLQEPLALGTLHGWKGAGGGQVLPLQCRGGCLEVAPTRPGHTTVSFIHSPQELGRICGRGAALPRWLLCFCGCPPSHGVPPLPFTSCFLAAWAWAAVALGHTCNRPVVHAECRAVCVCHAGERQEVLISHLMARLERLTP